MIDTCIYYIIYHALIDSIIMDLGYNWMGFGGEGRKRKSYVVLRVVSDSEEISEGK